MAALKEIMARTGLSDSDAKTYLGMAEDRVRLYLNYEDDEDISRFSSVIADIGVTLYDKQTAVTAAQTKWIANAGLSGKSYSEGPVSVSETFANASGSAGAAVAAGYDTQITQSLQSISRYRKVRVVKC